MSVKKNVAIAALVFCSTLVLIGKALGANPPINADQIVAQHLDSIASSAVRAGIKDRAVQGPVHFSILVGGAGSLDGKAFIVSESKKLLFMMKLPNTEYHGEQFIFDGDKDKVAFSDARQNRSAFGNFVFVQDAVIREGLLGGALSTAWPLLDINERRAKLDFDGLKKMDGQELYQLRYHPHKSTDLEINLYFDPKTYHHVETVYYYSVSEALTSGGETSVARQVPNRYRLTEKFSDFKTVDGVTLPTQEDIQFSQELQNGRTMLWDWNLKGLEITNNRGIDPKNFEVK